MDKLVSVIMSVYNEESKVLSKSIESILNQTYSNIEFVIVLDNPENKNLNNIITRYKEKDERIKYLVNESNIGLVKSLNKALNNCNGVYIARMDADDIAITNRIEIQKEYLEKNNLDFIFTNMEYINENEEYIGENNKKNINNKKLKEVISFINISNHPTWFLKKEIYKTLDGYREVPYCEDYDFTLRSLNKGYNIGKMNINTLKYRVRKSGISKSNSLNQFLNMRTLSKLYRDGDIDNTEKMLKAMYHNFEKASDNQKIKFDLASEKFNKGLNLINKKRYMNGGICIIYSILTSKFYRIKLYDMCKYKILLKKI